MRWWSEISSCVQYRTCRFINVLQLRIYVSPRSRFLYNEPGNRKRSKKKTAIRTMINCFLHLGRKNPFPFPFRGMPQTKVINQWRLEGWMRKTFLFSLYILLSFIKNIKVFHFFLIYSFNRHDSSVTIVSKVFDYHLFPVVKEYYIILFLWNLRTISQSK